MDKGFQKIDLKNTISPEDSLLGDTNNKNQESIGSLKRKTKGPKKLFEILLLIILPLIFLFSYLFISIRNIYSEAKKTKELVNKVVILIKSQNIEETKIELENTKKQLKKTEDAYYRLAFMKFIPVLGNYYKDGTHLFKAANASIEAFQIAVDALIPYADLLGFKGQSTFVSGSADQRIQTAVQTLDKLTPKLGEIAAKIEVIKTNLDAINLDRYPNRVGDIELRSQLVLLKDNVDSTSTLFINARPLLENLPNLLGQPTPKKYLVLFQNDKELRPTGGFITAYALFKIDKGKAIVETSDDIYKLDELLNSKISPPKQFVTHLKQFQLHLRDANYEPDFVVSMKQFEEMYKKIPGTSTIDGIIAVDTHVLVEAMKILGPIPAYGINFTVENDPRCECPQVIYALEEYAGRRVAYIREQRKDIIGVLLYQIMQKALGVSPSQYWGKLFQMVLAEFNQKHILVYLHNEDSQRSLELLNYSGRMVKDIEGDYLHVNDANLGGAKSNMFVKNFIKQEYNLGADGSIIKTLTLEYKNPSEGSKGCNLEAGGLCLNGLMPNWLRVYVPKGSELLDFQGSEDPPSTYEAYDRTVFEGFLTVKPTSISQVKITYKLPQNLKGKSIPLYLQKQPGTEGHEVTILVNGKETDNFKLVEDKKLKINF